MHANRKRKVFHIFVLCCLLVWMLYIENSGQEIRRDIRLLGYLLSNQHCYMVVTVSVRFSFYKYFIREWRHMASFSDIILLYLVNNNPWAALDVFC